jgi:serine/threonine protein kinase
MAVVFRASDERLGRQVALKLLAPEYTADQAFRSRFSRESRAAATAEHPHIIPIYGAGEAAGYLFIAMRFVPGGDAKSALRRSGPFSAVRTWRIISQAAAALDAAHERGLVHRDVKPANLLLDAGARVPSRSAGSAAEPADHVYLTDFGISKLAQSPGLTMTGQIIGTLEYSAPEQIESQRVDGRADEYSLACAAFELLTGMTPFRRSQGPALIYAVLNEPPPPVTGSRPELSTAVDQVIGKAMAKAPSGRYGSCASFAADLGRALRLVPGPIVAVGQGLMPPVADVDRDQRDPSRRPAPPTRLAGDQPRSRPPGGQPPPTAPSMPPGGLARPAGNEPPTQKRER